MIKNNTNKGLHKNRSIIGILYNTLSSKFIWSSKKISAVIYVVLASIVVDTIINQNVNIRNSLDMTSNFSIVLFVLVALIAIIGQRLILEYVRQKGHEIREKVPQLNFSYKIAVAIQYTLIAVFIFVLVEIVVSWRYPSASLAVVTAASYGVNIGLMAMFTKIFFSWYKSNKNSIAVLLYGLSFAVVVITSSVFLTGSLYRFVEKPMYVFPDSDIKLTKSEPGSLLYLLGKVYHYADIASFGLKWIATAFLLYHYSKKMGRARYWILISLPLAYFLGTYLDDFKIWEPHTPSEEFNWHLYVTLNSTAGGILFYIGFVVAANHFSIGHGGRGEGDEDNNRKNNVAHNKEDFATGNRTDHPSHNSAIKDYLLISGFGFLLFYSAGQSTLANTLYPPYGLATMSFYGLSSFLILLGLYSSAFSVSEDVELRKSIRKSTLKESQFLDSMGTAHMKKELMKKMVLKAKEEQKERTQESGVKSSLNEEDIANIVKEVEKDVKEKKE